MGKGGKRPMKFITIRDLRNNTAAIRKDLTSEREIVLMANGRPFAVMTGVEPETLEEELLAIRRARACLAVERIRTKAKAAGLDRMNMDEVDAVIAEARRQRRAPR
jgi:antitoxin (DNA-binding transcriptional repressor) of toxin-antitoxin stability system